MIVHSPVAGRIAPISEVPDPVFAESMVGPGLAIWPVGGRQDAVAPLDGVVATLHPHAFVIIAEDGRGVLVHLGIDTVRQKGEGFTTYVQKGDSVHLGQALISWDPDLVTQAGYSPVVPVVALDALPESLFGSAESALPSDGEISRGASLFEWRV